MTNQAVLYLIPYFISCAISASIGLYAWRHRAVPGAAPYAWVALSQAAWTLGYIFELLNVSIDAKIFWDDVQFIAGAIATLALLAFALEYTGHKLAHPRATWAAIVAIPVMFIGLDLTDNAHHLIRPTATLIPGEPFTELTYPFSAAVWILFIYVLALSALSIGLLIQKIRQSPRLYRGQIALIIVGILIPIGGVMLTILGVTLSFHRDTTPLTFALDNLIVAWALFRFRLFDVVPAARHAVIESMSDAMIVLDAQDRLVDINPAAQRLINRRASDVIGRTAIQVFSPWPDLVEQFRDLEYIQTEIGIVIGVDQLYFDLRLLPLRDGHDHLTGRLVVAQDITRRKLAENEVKQRTVQLETANRELEAANERLQALSNVKDEFVTNVSHELRTPIMNLNLYLHLLKHRPEKRVEYLATLQRETARLENLIEGLLTLSRLDQDRVELNLAPLDLNELAQEYVTDRMALAESKGLTIACRSEPNLPPVQADQNLVGQVLSILLTNALNYTPAGGQVIVETGQSQTAGQRHVGFSVSDTGPGIPREEQEQLFTRFFRGKSGRKSGVAGTGLGLAIAQEIVERHHGQIVIDSAGTPGQGTQFSVWLPVLEFS
jgi:PAS domain S-box-containing protein